MTVLELFKLFAEKYSYCPETGVFLHKAGRYNAYKGKVAGTWKKEIQKNHINYYREISLRKDGKRYYLRAHRLAWFIIHGEIPNTIDHIKHARSKDDYLNRIENLRNGDTRDNSANRTDGLSKFLGVTLHKPTNKWIAKITADNERLHLGLFKEEEKASEVYQEALTAFKEKGLAGVLKVKEKYKQRK